MFRYTAAAIAVATSLLAVVPSIAAERNDPAPGSSRGLAATSAKRPSAPATLATTQAVANASYARMALVWDFEYGITRSKGVSSVRNPSVGVYCVKPAGMTATTVKSLVPVVSPDYSGSIGDVLFAYYRSQAPGCYSTEIGVTTRALVSGKFVASDDVGFTLIAP